MGDRNGLLRTRGLYAIVDPEHTGGRDPVAVARAIVEGGCAMLQLRAKGLGDAALLELARIVGGVCAQAHVPFVVNDRADVALLAHAQGLHLGQDDLPPDAARGVVGPDMGIGWSTHDSEQAQRAADLPVDLIGFGPVFATRTKAEADPVVGLEALRAVVRASELPVVAIGGITIETATAVARTGARWIATISGVCGAEDPRRAARALHLASGGEEADRFRFKPT